MCLLLMTLRICWNALFLYITEIKINWQLKQRIDNIEPAYAASSRDFAWPFGNENTFFYILRYNDKVLGIRHYFDTISI